MLLLITSASAEVWNGNMLVYSALLTHLYNILQSDLPGRGTENGAEFCQTLSAPPPMKMADLI